MELVNYDYILVRYGELSTKGKNKRLFIQQLLNNIKFALKSFDLLEYKSDRDRLYIYLNGTNYRDVSARLIDVFGIRSFSPSVKCKSDLEEIIKQSLIIAKNEYENGKRTFKIKARRNDKLFPYVSDQINRECAKVILQNTDLKVDVHNPDINLIVEVHKDETYLTALVEYGKGGYPVRIGGKALLLLSGGIDSPVSGYEIMKRGVMIEAIHFASPPYTSDKAKDKVIELTKKLCRYQGPITINMVPFTDLQLAIYQNVPESYAITIMRRMMIRIADIVSKQNNCLALVTGESIGQVASQTLESISTINEVTKVPIIRPLATFDKLDIIDISKAINTYDISILPYEDCCTIFTPKDPSTKPKLSKCIEYESKFDYQKIIDDIITRIEKVVVEEGS